MVAPKAPRRITDEDSPLSKVWNDPCFQEGMASGWKHGVIFSAVAGAILFGGARKIPWIQRNINYPGRAFLTSSAFIYGFVINTEKKSLACTKRKEALERSLKKQKRSA